MTPVSANVRVDPAPAATPVNLLDLDREGLRAFFAGIGEKPFRADQVLKWVHHHGVDRFDAMTDLGRKLRERLQAESRIAVPEVLTEQISDDGTRKWLLRLDSGNSIETVFIPETGRGTLCVSSQVGCALDCSFCATARQGFNRNLSTAEIIGQVWRAHQAMDDFAPGSGRTVSNIVLMGMGEPLLNFEAVVRALKIMVEDLGYGYSKRRVTVSTAGVVPAIDRLREAVDVSLAVSLHAPTDALRDQLVPLNRKYPLAELMAACRRYVRGADHKKSITFEYVMLAGVNDGVDHAKALVKLVRGVPCKLNLIPFNPFEGAGYQRSGEEALHAFWNVLNRAGIRTILRRTRGDDIDAACGQLAGKVADRSRRQRRFAQPRYGEVC